jgi:hypothetical protein
MASLGDCCALRNLKDTTVASIKAVHLNVAHQVRFGAIWQVRLPAVESATRTFRDDGLKRNRGVGILLVGKYQTRLASLVLSFLKKALR